MPKELFPADVESATSSRTGSVDDLIDVLRLNLVPGLGPRTYQLLLERFNSPRGILAASIAELQQVRNVGPKLAMSIVTHGTEAAARAELAQARASVRPCSFATSRATRPHCRGFPIRQP